MHILENKYGGNVTLKDLLNSFSENQTQRSQKKMFSNMRDEHILMVGMDFLLENKTKISNKTKFKNECLVMGV